MIILICFISLSAELLEREILDSEEIDRIIRGENLPPVQKEVKTSRG